MLNELLDLLIYLSLPAGVLSIGGFVGCIVRPDIFKF